jgi:hypothetical protein
LPTDAPVVAFVSPQGAIDFVNRAVDAVTGAVGEPVPFRLPPFPDSPAIGWALTISPGELREEMVLPTEFLKALGRYIKQVQQEGVEGEEATEAI